MNYEELRSNIDKIVDISSSVPESLREKCFEILLSKFIDEQHISESATQTNIPFGVAVNGLPIPTPAQVRLFMTRNSITTEMLNDILMYADGEIHFIKEPSPSTLAEGQSQWTLLLCLKNGILNNSFTVDPEDVRSICQEKGFYDSPNFASILKRSSKFFKEPLQPQGKSQQLSSDGENELANLLKSLLR